MIDRYDLEAAALTPALDRFFSLAESKLFSLAEDWDSERGTPVFTEAGKYTSRGWTEWTQGFLYGCRLLQFDGTGDEALFASGRDDTLNKMAAHLTHHGVHDHGFNNISTYGNLLRLAHEGRSKDLEENMRLYELALRVSAAVQAARWSDTADGGGFIYSFNGPQSLFVDTIRSCRILVLGHHLGQVLLGENDRRISLLDRAVKHIRATLKYNVYFGEGRDIYDVRGRVAHESIFSVNDGQYRCAATQQGYAPFTTWTRGLAWGLLGCVEQLEFFRDHRRSLEEVEDGAVFIQEMLAGAQAMADFYLDNTPTDGVPYWDTGAPGLYQLGDYLNRPSEPDNPHEPVDSSAAVICAQALLRLGSYLGDAGTVYTQCGLKTAQSLFNAPYLSEDSAHQGLILHSIYHRPNGWDYLPPGKAVPQGESSMWGDYHAMELAVYLQRMIQNQPTLYFYG
ncbi:MAG: glycosyl hydrolase [Candidatus Hydrogenedentes bacterium]|nr:glycosyl hydrolase [Candidatus Hydrogenedentota bacterium]